MTSYATCAYAGCMERVPYEPRGDKWRDRYCKRHMKVMVARLGNYASDDALTIEVKHAR